MSILALSNVLDVALSLTVTAAAVIWLAVRGFRLVTRKRTGGCACPSATTCGTGKGPTVADLRGAAARAADRLNRSTPGKR